MSIIQPLLVSLAGEGQKGQLVALRYLDVALRAQVVDLGGLDLVDDLHQTRAVRQVAVVQLHVLTRRRRDVSTGFGQTDRQTDSAGSA